MLGIRRRNRQEHVRKGTIPGEGGFRLLFYFPKQDGSLLRYAMPKLPYLQVSKRTTGRNALLEGEHLQSGKGGFLTLVAVLAPCALECLRLAEGGEHAKNYRLFRS